MLMAHQRRREAIPKDTVILINRAVFFFFSGPS